LKPRGWTYSIDAVASSPVRPRALAVDVTGYDVREVLKAVRDAKVLMGGTCHAITLW